MNSSTLLLRSLTHYWRTNAAVVGGVGVAVAVLAGALLVGVSVRGSLRDLALLRLGRVDRVVSSATFFREALAAEMGATVSEVSAPASIPLIALEGFVTHQTSGRRAGSVQVFGVDDRFWAFHGVDTVGAPGAGDVFVSEGLARELGVAQSEALLVRVEKPSAIPVSSLHGRRDDLGRTARFTVRRVLAPDELGEFSFRPQQGLARSVFVSLARLQRDLEQNGRVNTILLGARRLALGANTTPAAAASPSSDVAAAEDALRRAVTLDDLGLEVTAVPDQDVVLVESRAGLLRDPIVEAVNATAAQAGLRRQAVLTYLANDIRMGDRSIPYSLVTAIDLSTLGIDASAAADSRPPPIVLNAWAADDLGTRPGDVVSLEYYVWAEEGRLLTERAEFRVAAVVPIAGLAADRRLAPDYPGITTAASVGDWDPPFEVDLRRIRPQDEAYWDAYRTTSKAFVPLEAGQRLWQSRWGQVTSLRLLAPDAPDLDAAASAYGDVLRATLDPIANGFVVYPARALALEASLGATDFGEYFTYFSFFLVVSALLLASLFFRLGVEQRLTEIGLLRACGFPPARIHRQFWAEALTLALAGAIVGVPAAVAYARLIMWGLGTWWVDAVGTHLLRLYVEPWPLVAGAAGGLAAAFVSSAVALRSLASASPRSLLAGALPETTRSFDVDPAAGPIASRKPGRTSGLAAVGLGACGVAVLGAALAGAVDDTAGFFGAGLLLLGALLSFVWSRLHARPDRGAAGPAWSIVRIGIRNATWRPGRSVLCIALIASATFIIVAVDAFRRESVDIALDPKSGTGGYTLLAESLLPIVHDPSSEAGREALLLTDDRLDGIDLVRFRVRPGEDASCLNLYQARDPRILAPTDAFVGSGRFAFSASLAETPEEAENPWLLLNKALPDGAVPAIADATSLTYALHLAVGDDFVLRAETDRPIRLRIVAALADSVFQRELLIGERQFVDLFPAQEGYRFFLIAASPDRAPEVTAALEDRLADHGFDVTPAGERLAAFHRVENTYLATFQTLGALGLLLGTLGLAAVLLRNVLERRRELALLRAVGYNRTALRTIVLAENAFLLVTGLGAGAVSALVAIAPAWWERGGRLPLGSLGWLLAAVAVTGLIASLVATAAALRAPLLSALRTE